MANETHNKKSAKEDDVGFLHNMLCQIHTNRVVEIFEVLSLPYETRIAHGLDDEMINKILKLAQEYVKQNGVVYYKALEDVTSKINELMGGIAEQANADADNLDNFDFDVEDL